jgi:hypothetical protein
MTFVKTLGLDMNVYETTLGGKDNVYITKHLLHQSAYAAIYGIADADVKINDPLNKAIRTTTKAKVDRKTARIVELTWSYIDFLSAAVRHIQMSISPCITTVIVGPSGSQYRLHFPAPVPPLPYPDFDCNPSAFPFDKIRRL